MRVREGRDGKRSMEREGRERDGKERDGRDGYALPMLEWRQVEEGEMIGKGVRNSGLSINLRMRDGRGVTDQCAYFRRDRMVRPDVTRGG